MMENWVLLLIAYKLLYMMGSYAAIKVLNTRKWSFVIGVVNTNVHIYKKKTSLFYNPTSTYGCI